MVLPSHIKQAHLSIYGISKNIDLIIHLIDSRSDTFISESDIYKIFSKKIPILNIHTKKDLSDNWSNIKNSFDLKDSLSRVSIIKLIKDKLKQNNKGEYLICGRVIVIGIPNVGKSTLINLLKKSKSAIKQNTPGTTKQITLYKIEKQIYIYDTPGILTPSVKNKEVLRKLFLLNSLPVNDENNLLFLRDAYNYLFNNYPSIIIERFALTENLPNYDDFLIYLAQKNNWKKKNNELNIDFAENYFLKSIHSGKIGKLTWSRDW